MPALFRVHIDGGYNANPEVWSCSFACTSDSAVPAQADMDENVANIRTYLSGSTDGVPNLKGMLSTAGEIRQVRLYWYPDVGAPAARAAVAGGLPITGSGTFDHPTQVAFVISLLTGDPGPSGRGRIYWPGVGAAVNTTGKTTEAGATAASNIRASLELMAALAGPESGSALAVASAARGTVTPVNAVRIGDVLDTQRRRRDNLQEIYYTSTV